MCSRGSARPSSPGGRRPPRTLGQDDKTVPCPQEAQNPAAVRGRSAGDLVLLWGCPSGGGVQVREAALTPTPWSGAEDEAEEETKGQGWGLKCGSVCKLI